MGVLKDLSIGEKGRVAEVCCDSAIGRRLADIGLIQGTLVECVGIAPLGDPAAFLIRGAVIALRNRDTEKIMIEEVEG